MTWNAALWWLAAIASGLFGVACFSGFFLGAVESCTGVSLEGETVSESCETNWAPVIYLTAFGILSFVGMGLAIGRIRRLARENQPRSERRRS